MQLCEAATSIGQSILAKSIVQSKPNVIFEHRLVVFSMCSSTICNWCAVTRVRGVCVHVAVSVFACSSVCERARQAMSHPKWLYRNENQLNELVEYKKIHSSIDVVYIIMLCDRIFVVHCVDCGFSAGYTRNIHLHSSEWAAERKKI